MKLFLIILAIYIQMTLVLSFTLGENSKGSRAAISECTTNGEQIGDDANNTIYYICIQGGDGTWTQIPQNCAPGGVFVPDPVNPGCVLEEATSPPTTELITTTEEMTSTEEILTTEEITSTEAPTTTEQSTTAAATTEQSTTAAATTEQSTTAATTEQSTTAATTEQSTTAASTEQTTIAASTEQSTMETTAEQSTTQSAIVETTTESGTSVSSEVSTEISPTTPTTEPPVVWTCPAEGNYPDPMGRCNMWYKCLNLNGIWYFFVYTCPAGTNYNPSSQSCSASYVCNTTTTTTVATTTTTTTTLAPPVGSTTIDTTTSGPICPSEGKFPTAGSCTSYYQCILFNSIWYQFTYNCPTGTHYDADKMMCKAGTCTVVTTPTSQITTVETPGGGSSTTPAEITTVATTSAGDRETSTVAPYTCYSQGLFPDPFVCTAYYQCVQISGNWYYYKYNCPAGTYYNTASSTCRAGTC